MKSDSQSVKAPSTSLSGRQDDFGPDSLWVVRQGEGVNEGVLGHRHVAALQVIFNVCKKKKKTFTNPNYCSGAMFLHLQCTVYILQGGFILIDLIEWFNMKPHAAPQQHRKSE